LFFNVRQQSVLLKAGTITLFAFDKEQGLSEYISPYDTIAYILDGETEIVILIRPSM